MAGLFVVAGIAMVDRHRQKRQAKEAKIVFDDIRYAALQEETRQRQEESRQRIAQTPPISSDAYTLRLLTSNDLAPVDLNLDDNIQQRKPSRPTLKSRRSSWYDPRSWSEKKARRVSRVPAEISPWNYS